MFRKAKPLGALGIIKKFGTAILINELKMSNKFIDHNDFDRYAREHGGWAYDNGWRYKDDSFGASYIGKEFGSVKTGDYEFIQMLREGKLPTKTVIIHIVGPKVTEIWSGEVITESDFDEMMKTVDGYILQHEEKNKTGS
jgi:hypothetical protein